MSLLSLHFKILGSIVLLLWALAFVNEAFLGGRLCRFGIRPRQREGINGIFFCPLLHADFSHLAANTIPLVILGEFLLLSGVQVFAIATVVIWIVGGWAVWFLGRPHTNHVGASGLVFGYIGFLLLRGYLEQSPGAIAIALLTNVLYLTTLRGIWPFQHPIISWEGHLFGLLSGGAAAYGLPRLNQWINLLLEGVG